MPAVRSASGPISVPRCDAPISRGMPSRAMRGASDMFRHVTDIPYALKYAIWVVVASRRPFGDHNSPFWSP